MSDDLFDIFEDDRHGKNKKRDKGHYDKHNSHSNNEMFKSSIFIQKLLENKWLLAGIILIGVIIISLIIYLIIWAVPHLIAFSNENTNLTKSLDIVKGFIN